MKNTPSICKWICVASALVMLGGCDGTESPKASSVIVRKKLTDAAPKSKPAPGETVAAVTPATAAPVPTPVQKAPEPGPQSVAAAVPVPTAVSSVVNASLPPAAAKKPLTMADAADAKMAELLNVKTPAPYNPTGKIDPFEPLVKDESPQAPTTTIKPVKRDRNSPLEKIDLGQLKLVAIITSGTGNRALVEETSGKGYILKEGTFVGLNSGKVVGIALDKVLIEEEYEDAYGKSLIKKKEITLPKPPGE